MQMLNSYLERSRSIDRLRNVGAIVEFPNALSRWTKRPMGIVMTRSALTDDLIDQSVRQISCLRYVFGGESNVTDQGLRLTTSLRRLEQLSLWKSAVSVGGLDGCQWLSSIRSLSLPNSQIDDGIWNVLKVTDNLVELSIGGTKVRTLDGLASLPHLRDLDLNSLPLAEDEFRKLLSLPRLENLYFNGGPWTSAHATIVAQLTSLRALAVGWCDFSDQDAEKIATLQNLSALSLPYTSISDRGLRSLLRLPNLIDLTVLGTNVSPDGLAELAKLPNLQTAMVDEDTYNLIPESIKSQIKGVICEISRDVVDAERGHLGSNPERQS